MVLTTLTWNLVGPVQIVSGTNINTQRNKQEFMATFISLIKSSSYWAIDKTDVTGSFYEAVVVKPVSSSVCANMRMIVTMDATGTSETVMGPSGIGFGNDTNTVNYLLMGITPNYLQNGGSTYVDGRWLGVGPFGTGPRWSRYWGSTIALTEYQHMYLIESQETLHVGVRGHATAHQAISAGALMVSHDSGSGEVDGRIFGMFSAGTTNVNVAMFNGVGFMNSYAGDSNAHMGCFVVSGNVPNGPGGAADDPNDWDYIFVQGYFSFLAATDTGYGQTTTAQETLIGVPINVFANQPAGSHTTRAVGRLRQAYAIQDYPGLVYIVTGTNQTTKIGLTFGSTPFSANDTLFLSNT